MDLRLGYYECDNKIFSSKIEACIYATMTKKPLNWNFNDDVFSKFDWTVEPKETLDELYNYRAREIREKYDYIVISYSAGADSHNLLSAFIRQNLHVDEIITNTMSTADKNLAASSTLLTSAKNASASEFRLQSIPRLQELQNLLPKTKFTVVDLTQHAFDQFTMIGDDSWVSSKRESLNPLNTSRYNYKYLIEIRKNMDRNIKIAMVMGVDKPRTFFKNGEFYLAFNDRAANITSIDDHFHDYDNLTVEYFYWHPDSVKMLCKQAHVIKRWTEASVARRKQWDNATDPTVFRLLHERLLRTIIYSTWDNSWYQADKSTSDWHNEFDDWFINGQVGNKAHTIWLKGLEYVTSRATDYLKFKDGKPDGLKPFYKIYYIGKEKNEIIY